MTPSSSTWLARLTAGAELQRAAGALADQEKARAQAEAQAQTNRAYFGQNKDQDSIGYIDENTRAIFGRSYAAEPDKLIEELKRDEAVAEADTLLLTVPNQLGVDYNAHVLQSILTHVAPSLGWR